MPGVAGKVWKGSTAGRFAGACGVEASQGLSACGCPMRVPGALCANAAPATHTSTPEMKIAPRNVTTLVCSTGLTTTQQDATALAALNTFWKLIRGNRELRRAIVRAPSRNIARRVWNGT